MKTALKCGLLFIGLSWLAHSAAAVPGGFTENKGQVSDQFHKQRQDVFFSASSAQFDAHFKLDGYSLQLFRLEMPAEKPRSTWIKNMPVTFYRIDALFINASKNLSLLKGNELPGYDNYYLSVCPSGALEVRSYESITYHNLYPGIDLKWYKRNSQLKYDYLVKAGSDYSQIAWVLEGATGLSINQNGQLLMTSPLGILLEEAPLVMQNGRKLPSAWVLKGDTLSFRISNVSAEYDLVIDPLIRLWGSYYGGNQGEHPGYVTTDAGGNVYFSGDTWSTANIATTGAWQNTYGGGPASPGTPGDAILVKMNANGVRLWSTYYGGSGFEFGNRCRADNNGNIYLVGGTTSTNTGVIATNDGFQSTLSSTNITQEGDGFLVKFNSNGIRLWGTYYGDLNDDWLIGLAIDRNNDVVVSGTSWSQPNIPYTLGTPGTQQTVHSAGSYNGDGVLAKFNANGLRLWSTYYGGTGEDTGADCVTDTLNNIYLVGVTTSSVASIISSSGGFQQIYGGGPGAGDGYFAKFSSAGTRLWGSYYGEAQEDKIVSCAVDPGNQLLLFGTTTSMFGTLFGTAGAHQPASGGGNSDAFLSRFTPGGIRKWSTYYGGGGYEESGAGCVSAGSAIFICGRTSFGSAAAIVSCGALQSSHGGGGNDAFIARFDTTGLRKWGSYFGGSGDESTWFCSAADNSNNLYLLGMVSSGSGSSAIAGAVAQQPAYGGGTSDMFIEKFDPCIPSPPGITSGNMACVGNSVVLQTAYNCGLKWYSDPSLNNLIYSGGSFTTGILNGDTTYYLTESSCGYPSAPSSIQLTATPSPTVSASASFTSICAGNSSTLSASGAGSYTWTGGSNQNQVVVSPTTTTTFTVRGSNSYGCVSAGTVLVKVDQCTDIGDMDKENTVTLFPNPASGLTTLRATSSGRLKLYNAAGILVLSISKTEAIQELDTSELPEGLYLGRLECSNTIELFRLVVLHH